MKKFLAGLAAVFLIVIGIGSANASMLVEVFSNTPMNNLADAEVAIGGNADYSTYSNTVDFWDGAGGSGHWSGGSSFGVAPNYFALNATGVLNITTAGTYTFGTNNDDGVRLTIDGATVIEDDSLHPTRDYFGAITLSAGLHSLDLLFFEKDGGASIELFAAMGNFTSFNQASFELVGASNGLEIAPVPEPATMMLFGLGLLGLAGVSRRKK